MSALLSPVRLTGAHILVEGRLQTGAIGLSDGVLTDAPLPEVDLSGFLVLPGIVDLHGDGFERHITPRPTAPFPMITGLAAFDREAAAHGITTAWMAQSWSWEGAQRSPEVAEALLWALDSYRPRTLTDLRVQIRAETHLVRETDRLIATVARHGVDFVVFNNHLEEGVQMARTAPGRFEHWAHRLNRTVEDLSAEIAAAEAAGPEVPASLARMAAAWVPLGVTLGSHDDPDPATRAAFRALGAEVAEFPLTPAVAAAARDTGAPVLMGAPNVVRGGSQAGNVSAIEIVAAGHCDALVSDYHVPAMALAAFALADLGVLDLGRAWEMISTQPARILKLADRGRLLPGLRADLVVVNPASRVIEATIAGGRLSHLSGEAGRRFLACGRTDAR